MEEENPEENFENIENDIVPPDASAETLPEAEAPDTSQSPLDGEQDAEEQSQVGERQSEVFTDGEKQNGTTNANTFSEKSETTVGETVEKDAWITESEIDEREEDSRKRKGQEKKTKGKKGKGKRGEKEQVKREEHGEEKAAVAKAKQGKKGKKKKAVRGGGGEGDVEKPEKQQVKGKIKKEETEKEKKTRGKVKKDKEGGGEGDVRENREEEEEEGEELIVETATKGKKVKGKGRSKKRKDKEGKKKKKQKAAVNEERAFEEKEDTMSTEVSFVKSRSIPDGSLALPGVKRITISREAQQQLGCEIGVNVTSESPWVLVEKQLIDNIIFLHTDSSDFLPIKQEFQDVNMTSILIGYDALNDEPNQFYICLTESAKEAILEMLEEMKQEQQRRLENALEKTPREWTSLGSEVEVQLFNIQDSRPYMRVLVETTAEKIHRPCTFSDRNVEDAKDGYYRFSKRDEPPDQIWCYRLDAGVQVRNPKVDAETQTRPYIPYNSWTQYEYDVDTEAPIEDEDVLKALAEFLERVEAPMSEILSYNEILDNYRDDYAKLVVHEEDTDVPLSFEFTEFMSFTDMKHCQGKAVSCIAFHPMWTGIVAIAYVEQGNVDVPKLERPDQIAQEVYASNRVLIWSLNDAFKPKLLLESPREVYSLAFAPHHEELLVGGLSNGQIVIWDIKGKIERVETEIKLTPAQIRHNLSMMNMMDWMKQTIHIQYLRPVAVSSMQHSHTDTVYELRFLHPNWTITPGGKFETLQDANSTLLMSVSMDSSILVWNLDPETNPVVSIAVRARKRKTARRPDGLKSEVSRYAVFHRAISPSLKVELPLTGDRAGEMFRSMDLYIPAVQYNPDEEEWAKLTPKQKESSATRFKYLPDLTTSEEDAQLEQAFVGTVPGKVLAMDWADSEPRGSTVIQNLNSNVKYTSHIHSGPVLRVIRSPFIKDLYLTIDWDKFALWSTKLKNKPFLLRRQKGGKRYLYGSWSIISAMTFRLCCSDGSIEVWDLQTRSEIHTILQNLSGKSLNIIENHPRPLPSNLIGVADSTGCFRLFFIPLRYQEASHDCEEKMNAMIDREVKRAATMQQWVAEWTKKHAEELKRKKSEEAKMRGQDAKTLEQEDIGAHKQEDNIEVVEKPVPKKIKYDGRILEASRKHMLKMMMEKKRIDRDDLERKRAPLVQAQEAMQLKHMKLREAMKNKNTIFREYINVMFPNVAEKPPPKPTDCEILAAELEEKQDSFIQDYKELEKVALAKLRQPEVVDGFNWNRVLKEGRKRREVLDSELYQQTEWKERTIERRNERRRHRESEQRREDDKRRRKGLAMTSQIILQSDSNAMLEEDERDVEWTTSRMLTPSTSSKISVKHKQSSKSQSSKVTVKQKESKAMLPTDESALTLQQGESKILLSPKEQSKHDSVK